MCMCIEIFGKQRTSMLKHIYFLEGVGVGGEINQCCTECVQGILLVPGRRSKNKRWGGSGFSFIDWDGKRIVAGCHSWKLRTSRQSFVWLSKKLWRQQETKDFKAYYSSTKSKVVSLFKNTRLPRWQIERDCCSWNGVFIFQLIRFLCVATTIAFCQLTMTI